MSTVTFVILAVVAISTQAIPVQINDQLVAAAASGNWDEFRRLLSQGLGSETFDDVKTLRGGPNTHVFGQSEYTFKSSSSLNGQTVSDFSAGHKVTNNDGDVTEYDFKP